MSDDHYTDDLTQLGESSAIAKSPDDAVIEVVDNPHTSVDYHIRFSCPEFTSLCPVTGQPDFAHIVIDYIPRNKLIESKALKLYLHSFRNHGGFHEECTVSIAKKLIAAADPVWLRIGGFWYPRGGIPIDVFYQNTDKPAHVWVPDMEVTPYRGRG